MKQEKQASPRLAVYFTQHKAEQYDSDSFNFNGITHVIENPSGHSEGYNYSLVGAVPVSMLDEKPATRADVMGGRAKYAADGALVAWRGRQWRTIGDILSTASRYPDVKMCSTPGCACRKLF